MSRLAVATAIGQPRILDTFWRIMGNLLGEHATANRRYRCGLGCRQTQSVRCSSGGPAAPSARALTRKAGERDLALYRARASWNQAGAKTQGSVTHRPLAHLAPEAGGSGMRARLRSVRE